MQNNLTFKEIKNLWVQSSWEVLSKIDIKAYKNHSKRAKIALFIASAHQHLNHTKIANKYMKKSLKWGISDIEVHKIFMHDIEHTLAIIKFLHSNTQEDSTFIKYAEKNPNKRDIQTSYLEKIVTKCLQTSDYLEAIDNYLLGNDLSDEQKFYLSCLAAERIGLNKDRNQGINLINNAKLFINTKEYIARNQYIKLIEIIAKINQQDLLVDLFIESTFLSDEYTEETKEKIIAGYTKIRAESKKNQQHGHDLIINYIKENVFPSEKEQKLLLEIGTTRENVPGQGSTQQLAQLCKDKNIEFITIDMDPHNSKWANLVAKKRNLPITTITGKGENYLRDNIESFDFLFLDAYDFDHGKHSELRQSRYEKYLGNKIEEEACHIMHLECAYSIEKKLSPNGVVCIDDTWQDDLGNWTAKGTLAIPYLLSHGFEIIEARNNAVLMKRLTINKETN